MLKISAYRSHWISRPMRIVSPLQWRKKNLMWWPKFVFIFLHFFWLTFFVVEGDLTFFLWRGPFFPFFFWWSKLFFLEGVTKKFGSVLFLKLFFEQLKKNCFLRGGGAGLWLNPPSGANSVKIGWSTLELYIIEIFHEEKKCFWVVS